MTDASHDTQPIDREYLDLRLDAMESRIDKRSVELELRLVDRVQQLERRIAAGAGVLLVAVLGTLLAVIVK